MEVRDSTSNFAARRRLQDGTQKSPPSPLRAEISRRFSVMKSQPTPPDTPIKSQARSSLVQDQPLFHNYLRAFCKYDPPSEDDAQDAALLSTVRIRPGDLILLHSVHANGWADGTVLTTNERGWLPTNYCETFDHPYMRNLLNAMTQFWDLLGARQDDNLSTFVRQDYIRPLIAGVRYLLEHADCLHRDAKMIQRSTGLHRLRKGLLADLSTLVQIAKSLQETVRGPYVETDVLDLLDQSMAKACKVVTRAVGFVDMLAREEDEPDAAPARGASPLRSTVTRIGSKKRPSQSGGVVHIIHQEGKSPGVRSPGGVTSHRLSMVKTEPRSTSGSLASERLARAHDLCISHIAGFIGLYLHPSIPATDLVATTDKLRVACTSMLDVVQQISVFEPHRQDTIQQARQKFLMKYAELNASTDELVTDSDTLEQDIVMLPERTDHLVSLGTALIKRVGDCVVKVRKVIEQIGDFDLDKPPMVREEHETERSLPSPNTQALPGAWPAAEEYAAVGFADSEERRTSDDHTEASPTLRPSLASAGDGAVISADEAARAKTASPSHQEVFTATSRLSPLRATIVEVVATEPNTSTSDTRKDSKFSQTLQVSPARKMSVGASTAGSTTGTQKSSMRDSDISAVSLVSTRATTPDQSKEKDFRNLYSSGSVASMHSPAIRNAVSDDAEAHLLQKTYANELTLNKDGQVTGGSLPALVEQLTTADSAPDAQFVAAFFVTFRSFTTPRGLAKALIERFDYAGESRFVGLPIRMRVADALTAWLETYWNMDRDKDALGDLRYFALHKLKPVLRAPADRLLDVVRKLSVLYQSGGAHVNRKIAVSATSQDEKPPEASMSKSQLNALRKALAAEGTDCAILDFDALEIARQLTVLASKIFCEIQPEELLSLEWNKKDSTKAQNVRHMCTLNTDLAHFVGDTILTPEDAKKRASVIKHWSKVADRCLELNNYESLMAIMCSINSSVVQRLKRTWEAVGKKTKSKVEELNTIVDFSRNQASLRRRLENVHTPCLPFLGIYLTDLTMVDAGNPKHRDLPNSTNSDLGVTTVINFDKHMRLAKIITHIQSFQVPYNLKTVPELQTWFELHLERMRGRQAQMVGDFHRRSLYIEPRRAPGAAVTNVPIPKIPESRRGNGAGNSVTADSAMSTTTNSSVTTGASRPKTPASGQASKSYKPRGQTLEFLLKANFNFKGAQNAQQKPEYDKDLPPLPSSHEL